MTKHYSVFHQFLAYHRNPVQSGIFIKCSLKICVKIGRNKELMKIKIGNENLKMYGVMYGHLDFKHFLCSEFKNDN